MDGVIGCSMDMSDFVPGAGSNERIGMRRDVRNEECGSMSFEIGWGEGEEVLIVELDLEDFFQ
jgi:hypothetical protein